VVVDFPVEDDHEATIGRQHRLVSSGRQIDDRQAPVAEPYYAIGPAARVIRATALRAIHASRSVPAVAGGTVVKDTDDAAHAVDSLWLVTPPGAVGRAELGNSIHLPRQFSAI